MDMAAKIIDLRTRAARGEEITDAELREVIQAVRVSRTAAQASTNSKKKAATPVTDDQLMKMLGG